MTEQPVNINTADMLVLATLPGISMKLAERIVAHRQEQGLFGDVADLTAVSGISARMVAQMADRIVVQAPAEAPADAVDTTADVVDTTSIPSQAEETAASDTVVPDERPLAEPEEPLTATGQDEPEVTPIRITAVPEMAAPKQETQPFRAAAPPAAAVITPAPVPRQRSGMVGSIIAAVFGAILGTTLTLSILYGFNETLQYASSAQAGERQRQLETELLTLQQSQQQLQNDLEAVNSQIEALTATQEDTAVAAATTQANLEALQAAAADLQSKADDLNTRLETVAASAEDFDTFLTGLRDLLVNVAGPPTLTATPIPPTTMPTASATPATTATATTDPAATRTPRPTATSISLPTHTPTVMPQP